MNTVPVDSSEPLPPGIAAHCPALSVYILPVAHLSDHALRDSYEQAERFFALHASSLYENGKPLAVLCSTALLWPALDAFLPHVTNWAVCDLISPALFKKRPASLMPKIDEWLKSGDVYAVRFGLGMLMAHYLDAPYFTEEVLGRAAGVTSDEYYLKMMVAWLFATALAKQYDAALPYIKNRRLDAWTHNKAIQKAIESRRVTDGHKAELRTLKIK